MGPCLVFVRGGLRPLFSISLWKGPCVPAGAYVLNLWLMVYDSVGNIPIGNLICSGALSYIFCTDVYWGLVLYWLKVAFGHHFLISLGTGPCVLVGAYVLNLGLGVYDSVRSITLGNLICIGALSFIFRNDLY